MSKKIQSYPYSLLAFKEGLAICEKDPNLFLLCTGSSYLVGEIKEALGEKSYLRNFGELI